jgi:diguanylate cyclase (GGDEF)-like protein/putative nucleotidyltransferase with HDIG domain
MTPIRPLGYMDETEGEATPGNGAALGSLPEAVLSDLTHLLVSEGSPARVLDAVAEALSELVPHDTLTLYQADPSLRVLRPVLVRDADYAEEVLALGPIPYGAGITGTAGLSRTPLLVNDAHLDPRSIHIPGTPDAAESMLAIPLLARDELKGVLCLYRHNEGNHFNLREFKLAIVFSELAALAVDNAEIRTRLEAEVITDHLTALYNHRYFHERLAEELRRANRLRSSVGLLIYDIDDFKRVNDTYGHLVGDQVLQGVASISRETCRLEDVICRIGGEEFAIILPGADMEDAVALAERLRAGVASVAFPTAGPVAISVGVAQGPLHASSPRELTTCADLAMLEAKALGKDRVRVYLDREGGDPPEVRRGGLRLLSTSDPAVYAAGATKEGVVRSKASGIGNGLHARLASLAARGEVRSGAQLRMLQSLSAKLNRLNDVRHIGEVITAELRSLIDYHGCRVFLLQPDGETLLPIAFRGELSEYQGETVDALVVKVGEGITGHVAETGEPWYAPDAIIDPYAVQIPGTLEIEESILGVPMKYGDRVIGAVVLSKLGIDQFDLEDSRLLEALAASAAVAFENARLLQVEHEAAIQSLELLKLSEALTKVSDTDGVLDRALHSIPTMISCQGASAWIRDVQTGAFRLARSLAARTMLFEMPPDLEIDPETAALFLRSVEEPFVLSKEALSSAPDRYQPFLDPRDLMIAPMRWEPDGLGALAIVAPTSDRSFSPRDLQLARGIADITSLALGNARRFIELERTYVSTVEALANALEAKDAYTEDHCRALAEMSLAVGAEMGLAGERLKVLELGALFHDIGKIGVASEIIRKPGPLNAAERREMNRHPEIGAQILAPVPFLQTVRPIILASHERWDGKGYPEGLAGADIPVESRIVFVCDAFHAMTTDRPYRAALPQGEAIRRLKLASGTQFDPDVVSTFVKLHRQGKIHFH